MVKVIKEPDKKEVTTILGKDVHKIIEKYSDKEKYQDYRNKWKLASSLEYIPDFPLQIDFELLLEMVQKKKDLSLKKFLFYMLELETLMLRLN